ncbi:Wadjet anti-phage system protein JetD domain-containing protein [Phosphitispora fastidiosa]|uniref:Wadjet anti-phage system protein JetD domain-containing protein n=1 Tax=Phosphitispora fastidiosa TaxID=2837202 RepID=UPI001E2B213D|nr:Wadjet anti-phage system protein JetD domain-containing protein [Phosphitispora fastidiosa]
MKQAVISFIVNQKKKLIECELIERHVIGSLGIDGYWKAGGYPVLAEIITDMVEKGILSPVKARGINCKSPELYNIYRIVPSDEKPELEKRRQLLTQYHPMINTSFYLRHVKELEQDERYISLLDRFLKDNPDLGKLTPITVNERSFQVFRDEKWLLSVQGQNFLQRVGLDLDKLQCYITHEPFFYYSKKQNSGPVNVLIVENKDTFFSLKTLFQEGINSWDGIEFSLLIYGEGRKIEKSISFYGELDDYQNVTSEFCYFGDLDPEGISIWHALAAKIPVKPFVFFYKILFEKYGFDAPVVRKNQRFSHEAVEEFAAYFTKDIAAGMKKMLMAGYYLPQEGLDYAAMRVLAAEQKD